MVFFWLDKILFLLYTSPKSTGLNRMEVAGIFFYGSRMDISTACYLISLPALLLLFRHFIPAGFVNRFVRIYTIVLIGICSVLIALDLGLYPHWGTRINATIFNYIDEPQALAASVSLADTGVIVLMVLMITIFFSWLYTKFLPQGIVVEGKIRLAYFPVELFVVASLIIPIRGGLDTSPLNLSSVAFSQNLYVNQAAANFLWNFGNSIDKMKRLANPCNYMPHPESEKLFDDFMKTDTIVPHPQLIRLNPERQPNVILIILESFSDKVIGQLGGKYQVTPNLDSLCTQSTVFTRFYSTGNRSDRGISAILGGYPSLLSTSIMVYPEKCRSLTLLPEYFDRKDYSTSFYYGGDINFNGVSDHLP
jgi:phosphoglycerol transferase MdoB-like AlkP superfamily enzyme